MMPASREGWMNWYIARFNKKSASTNPVERELEICATQALWFFLNILAFGDRSYSPLRDKEEEQCPNSLSPFKSEKATSAVMA